MTTLTHGEVPIPGVEALEVAPKVWQIRRLVDANEVTTMVIPDESVTRMASDYAEAFGETADETHRRFILAHHIEHTMTGKSKHAPLDAWTDIEVEGDPELTQHFRNRFSIPEKVV
jgi:hypothetical protein